MSLLAKYPDARSVAYAVRDELEGFWQSISVHPWNRYDPDNGLWWVIASTDWPAYKHGKLVFDRGDEYTLTGRLFCGLHVEKGFGERVAQVYPALRNRNEIMTSEWCWWRFMQGFKDGSLQSAAKEVAEATSTPILLRLNAIFVEAPDSWDYHAPRRLQDDIVFELNNGILNCKKGRTPLRILIQAKRSSSLSELREAISNISKAGWIWLDFFIGTGCDISTAGDANAWDASRLWKKVLSKWQPWLR